MTNAQVLVTNVEVLVTNVEVLVTNVEAVVTTQEENTMLRDRLLDNESAIAKQTCRYRFWVRMRSLFYSGFVFTITLSKYTATASPSLRADMTPICPEVNESSSNIPTL